MDDVIIINERLIEYFGKDVAIDKPNFRIVWTNSELEKRYDEFAIFTESGIYLRTEKGVHEVHKYEQEFQRNKWVLERLVSTAGNPYLERVTPYSYEPIWIFGCAGSDPQPIWRAVKLLVEETIRTKTFLTAKDVARLEAESLCREKALCKDILQDAGSAFHGTLAGGSTIIRP